MQLEGGHAITTHADWHGWVILYVDQRGSSGANQKAEASLHIGPLPGRRRIALYVKEDTSGVAIVSPIAYFPSEEMAERLLTILDLLILGPAARVR